MDVRHLDAAAFKQHFPTIGGYCSSIGINLKTDLVPIVPAVHYQCGGIDVNISARTSVANLYASGECAHTGLHGANRLASNSLLEAVVFSHQAAISVLEELDAIPEPQIPEIKVCEIMEAEADKGILQSLRSRLHEQMTYNLLNSSGKAEKTEAFESLKELGEMLNNYTPFNSGTPEFYELKNMVQVAGLILKDNLRNSALSKNQLMSKS